MSNALVFSKKAFTWTVVIATIAWAMSAAFIALPIQNAQAATLTAGDVIRGTVKSPYGGYPVYYYGSDGKRHLYPTASTYESWHGMDFSAVKVLTEAEVGAVPLGANVFIRPGSKLVKDEGSDPKVYAVAANGTRRHVSSEAVAMSLYGADWSKGIVMVPTGFFSTYTEGTAIAAAADYNKTAVLAAAPDVGTAMGLAATPSTPAPTGSLSAALASDNPAGSVLPGGASSAVLLKVNVMAGATAQTVTGLSIRMAGVGAMADFSNVYVYEGSTRLTSGRTLSTQTRGTEFSGLNLSVGANSTRTLSIVGDVAAGQVPGDTHAVQLTSLATTASVSGLPLTGSTFSMGSQDVSAVTVAGGTAPANPFTGSENVAISEFRLTAGTNDVELRRITVTVGGTVTIGDLSNFGLYQADTKLASGTVSGDRVTFELSSPYTISQGIQRIFTVKANVGGRGGRTVQTYVDSVYPSDLLVVDKVFSYGATVQFGDNDGTCEAAEFCGTDGPVTVTVQGARVTVAFNGPSASDVAVGSQDVPLFKFSMTGSDQLVEVRRLVVSLDGAAALAEMSDDDSGTQVNFFTDIKIKDEDTGAVLMGPQEITATGDVVAAQTFTFTDSWNLAAGSTRKLIVTADIRNTDDADLVANGYQVTLAQFNASSIRDTATGQFLATTDIVPNPAAGIVGNAMTVRASSLTVQRASTPISGTTVRGATGVDGVGISFAAGVQSQVKVTQVVMTGQGRVDTDGDGSLADETYAVGTLDDVIISARLYDGDTAISDWESPTTAGLLTFDNMNWTIPAGATKKVVAKVNVATAITNNLGAMWVGVNAAADITATDKDSNTVTATDGAGAWDNPQNNTPTVALTVQNSGQLTIDVDGDTALSNIIVSGSSGVDMAKLKFTPAFEDMLIKRLRLSNDAAADDVGITSVSLTYPKQDGTSETKTGVLSGGVADFSDLAFYAPVDRTSVLSVKVNLGAITEATVSGTTPTLSLDFGGTFEAVGARSGATLNEGSDIHGSGQATACSDGSGAATCYADAGTVSGNTMTVRKSKPTITLHAASPSGAAVPGLNEVLRFTVAADASGDIELAQLSFRVTATDNVAAGTDWRDSATGMMNGGTAQANSTTSDWQLYESTDLATALAGTWNYDDAAFTDDTADTGSARMAFTTARTIAAGTSKTYVLKVDTTGASSASDDSVRFDVRGDSAANSGTTSAACRATLATQNFCWNETSSGSVTGISGNLVKNLDVNGGTLVY